MELVVDRRPPARVALAGRQRGVRRGRRPCRPWRGSSRRCRGGCEERPVPGQAGEAVEPASPCAAGRPRGPCPRPYQPGRFDPRLGPGETQGMARRLSIDGRAVRSGRAPPAVSRAAGPTAPRSASRRGRTAANAGSSQTRARYAARDGRRELVHDRRRRRDRGARLASCSGVEAMSTRRGHLLQVAQGDDRVGVVAAMTSPCSVSFRRPSSDPGGWPRIARFMGPPPRPMAPPRPWKSVSSSRARRATVDQRGLGRVAASRPPRAVPIPCSSRSSRASPPGGRRAPARWAR